MRLGKYQEAIADYTKALEIESASALQALNARKETLQKGGESTEEIVTHKSSPKTIHTLEKRAKAYRKAGENQEALADLTKIIEESPQGFSSLGDAYFLRGLVYRQLNETEKMKQDWQKAESLEDKLVEGEYVQGRKQGPYIWYYSDGPVQAKATYVDDKKEGEFFRYHRNGQISDKGFYKQDKLEGPYTWFASSGKKSEEGTFKNGKLEGIFTTYDPPTGNLITKKSFANDELNGESVVLYWGNGQPQDKGTFKNGLRQGMSYRYYQNGQVEQEVPYENGLENGTAIVYNLDGSFKKKVFFKEGQRTGESYTP
jgi:antitoxin component YwqK of YwqJK toxin-antitoxin module